MGKEHEWVTEIWRSNTGFLIFLYFGPPRTERSGIIHGKVLTKQMFHDILIVEYTILLLHNKGGPTDGETEEL